MKYEIANPYESRLASRYFDKSRFSQRIACCLYFAWLRHRRWRIAKQAIRHLESLDEHRLEDIGITRAQIISVVRGRPEQQQKDAHSGVPEPTATTCNSMAA